MGTESGELEIVVVRKKVRRRANVAGLQLISPGMLNFRVNRPIMSRGLPRGQWAGLPESSTSRVISAAAQPRSHAFALSSLPQQSLARYATLTFAPLSSS